MNVAPQHPCRPARLSLFHAPARHIFRPRDRHATEENMTPPASAPRPVRRAPGFSAPGARRRLSAAGEGVGADTSLLCQPPDGAPLRMLGGACAHDEGAPKGRDEQTHIAPSDDPSDALDDSALSGTFYDARASQHEWLRRHEALAMAQSSSSGASIGGAKAEADEGAEVEAARALSGRSGYERSRSLEERDANPCRAASEGACRSHAR